VTAPKSDLSARQMFAASIEEYLLANKPRLHKQKQKCGELQSYLDATTQAVMQNA